MKLNDHFSAITIILKRYSPLYRKICRTIPLIEVDEYTYMDNCYNWQCYHVIFN